MRYFIPTQNRDLNCLITKMSIAFIFKNTSIPKIFHLIKGILLINQPTNLKNYGIDEVNPTYFSVSFSQPYLLSSILNELLSTLYYKCDR